MSRTKNILGGAGFGYVNQLLTMLAGLWLTPFLLAQIGQRDYGLWLVGTQVLTYLTLMDLGVIALLPRATSYAVGRAGGSKQAAELPDLIGETARLTLWQTPLVALAALVMWFAMPASWEALRWPLGLVMLSFVVTFPLRVFQAALQGLQDLAFIGKTFLASWAAGFACTVALVYAGWGLYSLAVAWVTTQAVGIVVFGLRLFRRFPEAFPNRVAKLPWAAARAQLGKGFWVSVAQVAQVLTVGTDILVLGKVLDPLAVVTYSCTGKLVGVLANQPQMLMQSASPALSEMKMSESRQRLFQVCTALSQAVLMISGAVICVILSVNQAFVRWWVGESQYGGGLLTLLLLAVMLLRHWNTTSVYAIFCFGHERRISVTTLLEGGVTVTAMLIFVRLFGVVGAPLGMMLGVSLVSLPLNLSTLARENGVSPARLLRPLWPWFWRFTLLAIGAWCSARVFTPANFPAICVSAAAAAIIYIAVMLPVALRAPLGTYVRPRLSMLLQRLSLPPVARDADI